MAAILIEHKANLLFEIYIYRNEQELDDFLQNKELSSFFVMSNISRNSVQQIERYFRRMLTKDYFLKLQQNPEETERIRRLYEIGARR
jgi:hypothetical protein